MTTPDWVRWLRALSVQRAVWVAVCGLDVAVDLLLARHDKTWLLMLGNALDRPSAARSGSAVGERTPSCCTASQWLVVQPRSVHFVALIVSLSFGHRPG